MSWLQAFTEFFPLQELQDRKKEQRDGSERRLRHSQKHPKEALLCPEQAICPSDTQHKRSEVLCEPDAARPRKLTFSFVSTT